MIAPGDPARRASQFGLGAGGIYAAHGCFWSPAVSEGTGLALLLGGVWRCLFMLGVAGGKPGRCGNGRRACLGLACWTITDLSFSGPSGPLTEV